MVKINDEVMPVLSKGIDELIDTLMEKNVAYYESPRGRYEFSKSYEPGYDRTILMKHNGNYLTTIHFIDEGDDDNYTNLKKIIKKQLRIWNWFIMNEFNTRSIMIALNELNFTPETSFDICDEHGNIEEFILKEKNDDVYGLYSVIDDEEYSEEIEHLADVKIKGRFSHRIGKICSIIKEHQNK